MYAAKNSKGPTRRPCIKGLDCTRSCCRPMTRYGVNKKIPSPNPPRKSKEVDSETDNSEDAGVDEPDCQPHSVSELKRSPSGEEFSREKFQCHNNFQEEQSPKNWSTTSPTRSTRSQASQFRHDTRTSNEAFKYANYIKLSILIGLVGYVWFCFVKTKNGSALSDFKKEMRKIGEEFKINADNILQIQKGIETTFKNEDTASILFLYRGTDENIVQEFVNRVGDVSARFLRNDTDNASPIIVKKSDLNMNTPKELLQKYRDDLKKQGIVMFSNLEDIPASLAMAFHYYCDEQDPLVKKTAIFFTLDLAKCKINEEEETKHEEAERCMMEKWQTLGKQRLLPLLTRVVNIVVDLEGQLS